MKRFAFFVFIFAFLALFLSAEEWFEKKPFQEWSEKDVRKLLEKSGWVDSELLAGSSSAEVVTRGAQMRGGVSMSGGGDNRQDTRITYRGYWYSARPMRMALARLALLNNPEMDLEGLRNFAESEMPDVVLALMVESNNPRAIQGVMRALRNVDLDTLAAETRLETKRDKQIKLKDFRPDEGDGTGAKFLFARIQADGRPVLEREDEEIRFETRFKAGNESVRVRLKWKTKDMMFKGELEY